MKNRYIVFDVETPNSFNNRMSAIGISVIENCSILKDYYYLVNPETHFDDFNIALTGITPKMVAEKPNFKKLWENISFLMDGGLLIAHNAPFDMSVLAKCLRHYDIYWKDLTYYACTCTLGRKCLKFLPNHRLNTICDYLNIPLNHHNASSDSHACAEILLYYIKRGIDIEAFSRPYDLNAIRTVRRIVNE